MTMQAAYVAGCLAWLAGCVAGPTTWLAVCVEGRKRQRSRLYNWLHVRVRKAQQHARGAGGQKTMCTPLDEAHPAVCAATMPRTLQCKL